MLRNLDVPKSLFDYLCEAFRVPTNLDAIDQNQPVWTSATPGLSTSVAVMEAYSSGTTFFQGNDRYTVRAPEANVLWSFVRVFMDSPVEFTAALHEKFVRDLQVMVGLSTSADPDLIRCQFLEYLVDYVLTDDQAAVSPTVTLDFALHLCTLEVQSVMSPALG